MPVQGFVSKLFFLLEKSCPKSKRDCLRAAVYTAFNIDLSKRQGGRYNNIYAYKIKTRLALKVPRKSFEHYKGYSQQHLRQIANYKLSYIRYLLKLIAFVSFTTLKFIQAAAASKSRE